MVNRTNRYQTPDDSKLDTQRASDDSTEYPWQFWGVVFLLLVIVVAIVTSWFGLAAD